MELEFRPVDLLRHTGLCISFAEDMDMCSFGTASQFHGTDSLGAARYIERMQAKLDADPEICLHVWYNDEVVGQLNLGHFINPSVGYIHVFYVVLHWRGQGIADRMEAYAGEWFRQRQFTSARLSVSPQNIRAMRFYSRRGWQDLGPRADKPEMHNMEKAFT